MSRKLARENTFKLIYEFTMNGETNQDTLNALCAVKDIDAEDRKYTNAVLNGVIDNFDLLKAVIAKFSKGFVLERVYKVDLSILLLSCYELLFTDIPKAASVNEAMELAKAYSTKKSNAFINGLLASVIKYEGNLVEDIKAEKERQMQEINNSEQEKQTEVEQGDECKDN